MCLGQDVIEISSDRNEGLGDWDSPEYKDTVGIRGKKEPKALVFQKMYSEEDSDQYIAEFKLCLKYEVRKGKKPVKKKLIVSLRGDISFVQFIINPEEDEFEPGLIFRSDEKGNPNLDDLEMLHNFDFDEITQIETDLSPMTSRAYDHEAGSSRIKRSRHVETIEEALLPNIHHEFLEWSGCSREAKSRYNTRLATLLPKLIYSPHIMDWQLLHKIGYGEEIDHMLKISLEEAQSNKDILFSVAWVRAFNIREPISPELCYEFYATYVFDEVSVDDELQSKKIISFRLGGYAHSPTLLEFARRLRVLHKMITYGLYQRTTGYEKIQKNDLWLLSMFEARHQNGYANVAWVIVKWIKRKGVGSHKDSKICCGQFISKIIRKSKVFTEDLYERIGSMDIRHEAIKRMEYRHTYYWDRYQGAFEHKAGVYNVPLQGDYNPPGYAQPQYDQYYQQYYPQQPPQQQHDDEDNE
uniref:Retrotransposon Orf1 n=1 Tax=Tanacetum cinerariifolium TaxID=118510 RepID=A0A699GMT7_TANCI|nr:retrotransposon Orf1 [Tanacetum cinerariifolium]